MAHAEHKNDASSVRTRRASRAAVSSLHSAESSANGKLLVVEDEGIVAADIAATLRRFGYDVVGISTSAEDCLLKAARLRPDLLLMDINLHGQMEGIDAAITVRERYQIPAIFLTAYADDTTISRAKLAEPVGYLIKPFKPNELRVVIEMALHRRRLEQRVERQQAFLEAIFDSAGVGIAVLDGKGHVVDANRTLGQMLGHPDDLIGLRLEHLGHTDLAAREGRYFDDLVHGRRQRYQMETRYVRANDEMAMGYVTSSRISTLDGAVHVVRVLSDISYARLEKVASFQENERHLISSELHDAISQPLAGVFYKLQAADQVIHANPDLAHQHLASSLEVVQHLLEDLSRIIYNLRSPVLDSVRIVDALGRVCDEFRNDTGVAVEAVVPAQIPGMGRLHALFLYRIVQESLTNVRRHAGAQHVGLHVEVDGERIRGRVTDDGQAPADGYQRDHAHRRKHFGVRAMRERAELLGGHLEVVARPEGGTMVAFEFPISEDASESLAL